MRDRSRLLCQWALWLAWLWRLGLKRLRLVWLRLVRLRLVWLVLQMRLVWVGRPQSFRRLRLLRLSLMVS